MIYLLWAAVVVNLVLVALLARSVAAVAGAQAEFNTAAVDSQNAQIGFNKAVIEKLRLVGQHID